MARGLTGGYLRRAESLALSALPITELTASVPEHHDGVMVALVPDEPEQLALDHEDALPADDLHVTLTFHGKVQDLSDADKAEILSKAHSVCDSVGSPFSATADGVVVMGSNDDGVPATAWLIQSDEIVGLYEALAEALDYESDYPTFIPHMTSGYGVPVEDAEEMVGRSISFSTVVVKFGDEKNMIPLASAITAADGANTIDRVVDSRGRLWDEGLHPRGSDGAFVRKDGAVSGKMAVTHPDGSTTTVDVRRAPVLGFKTIDDAVWVMVEILNEDGTTSQGVAKAETVKAVAQVKARLDDPDYADRVEAMREEVSVPDQPPAVGVS